MQKWTLLLCISCLAMGTAPAQTASPLQKTFRVGVVGLVHDHVHWILGRKIQDGVEIAGIAEPNRALAENLARQYGIPLSKVFSSLEEMVEKAKPEAVLAFNPISEHLNTVQYCAPRGIHVMVEKPLATTVAQANEMAALAQKHSIHLLTNYETTWYPSLTKTQQLLQQESTIGPLRRLVFHTGHQGPKEIGCSSPFLEWLTDPVKNGGGALTDFGCYGANITTWLMQGTPPLTVSAITQQIKPTVYPKVDDDATILLTYPQAQVIIQASWNWPYGRKDMEVYGRDGYLICPDGRHLQLRPSEKLPLDAVKLEPLAADRQDPFIYFAQVVRGNIKVAPADPSALPNNLTVVKILEAAKHAARTGTTVIWKDFYPD